MLITQVDTLRKGVNKYIVFDSADENEELLKKYNDFWNKIKSEINTINGGKENHVKNIT